LVRDEPTPQVAHCVFAYVEEEDGSEDKQINRFPSLTEFSSNITSAKAECYYSTQPNESDEESEEEVQVMHLNPGETRGWWKKNEGQKDKPSIATVQGAVCDRRTSILLDSGASTSIISLSLARELGLSLTRRADLSVKGMGGVTTKISAKANIKITLGHRLVYYLEVWVGNIGNQLDCLLGMDFMRAAGGPIECV
jgi:hypothetical protein